ncbi:MAG: acetate--CoA ligase family protein [Candidatus Korarchaeota archaeon]|nr:acetate--CoA ligase family protein [Candidatus Korarchaeota archaeon]
MGGILAVDELVERNGELASLTEETVKKLGEILPPRASIANPVDLTGDTSAKQYEKAVKTCMSDPNVDALICMYAPTGQLSPKSAAKALSTFSKSKKPILACWMGGEKVQRG